VFACFGEEEEKKKKNKQTKKMFPLINLYIELYWPKMHQSFSETKES